MIKLDKALEILKANDMAEEAMAIDNIIRQVKQFIDYDTICEDLSRYQTYFSREINEINLLYEDYNEEIIVMSGHELSERFIHKLEDIEYAGFHPYMFNEGMASKSDSFRLTKKQCISLGMTEWEFHDRKQNRWKILWVK